MFSYGSGLCSTMMIAKIHSNPLSNVQIKAISDRLSNRVKI
jgi:3-hydroxy-3-methylglutaryl CoA synthase